MPLLKYFDKYNPDFLVLSEIFRTFNFESFTKFGSYRFNIYFQVYDIISRFARGDACWCFYKYGDEMKMGHILAPSHSYLNQISH